MKRISAIAFGIVLLLLIAAFSVPFFIPKSVYKAQIEKAATNALQRDVVLSGDVNISVFPRISATVEDVQVVNPEGFAQPLMIEAGELRGSVKWLPLLSRRVDIQEIAFVDANVFLQKLADGRTNWEFGAAEEETAPDQPSEGGFEAGIASAVLQNASLLYQNDSSGERYEVTELDLEASMQALDKPLTLVASGSFQEQDFDLDVRLDSPDALTSNMPATAALILKSALGQARYDGTVQLGETPAFDGNFEATIPDVAALMRQLDIEVPAEQALERVEASGSVAGPVDALLLSALDLKHSGALLNASYKGNVSLQGDGQLDGSLSASSDNLRALLSAADVELAPGDTLQTFSLSSDTNGSFKSIGLKNLVFKLDDMSGSGSAGMDMSKDTPLITGDLSIPVLDLTPFMGEPAAGSSSSSTGIQPWSKEPFDLSGLRAVNADLNLVTDALTVGDIKLTDAVIAVKLTDGRLVADLKKFKAFNGNWAGKMTVNAQSDTPVLSFDMKGDSVAMSDLLGTLSGFDRLTGTGQFNVTAQATGNSIDAIMQGIDGEVSTNLADGALKGLNVAGLVRSATSLREALTSGSLQKLDFTSALSPASETEFTSFDTVLTIQNGVANVNVLELLSPVLGVDGSGQINLGGQSLDLRLATSIDKSAQGEGSVIQLNGIPVPIRISGSWNKLKVTPDLSGITSSLEAELGAKLRDQLGNRLGGSKSGESGTNPEDIIGGLLGIPRDGTSKPAPSAPGTDTEAETPPKKTNEDLAREALGGLFGKQSPKEESTE